VDGADGEADYPSDTELSDTEEVEGEGGDSESEAEVG
jgi:hypothetical protein